MNNEEARVNYWFRSYIKELNLVPTLVQEIITDYWRERQCAIVWQIPAEYIFVTHWEHVYGINKLFLKVCDWFGETEKGP